MIWGAAGGLVATPAVVMLAQRLRHQAKSVSRAGWVALAIACVIAGICATTIAPPAAGVVYAAALMNFVAAAAVDATEQRLPYALTIGGGAAIFAALIVVTVATGVGDPWRALAGGAIFGGWILLGSLAVRDGYGLGDVKFAAGVGTLLAWHSWLALAVGVLVSQIAVTGLLLQARHRREATAALGPAFALGAIAASALLMT